MTIDTKDVKGFMWPVEDVHCAAVVFDWLEHLDLALKHVKNFHTAVQAGGNCGVWPKRLGLSFQRVYTFEPEPRNFHCLVNNCQEQHIIKLQACVGSHHEPPVALDYVAGPKNLGAAAIDKATVPRGPFPVQAIDNLNLKACDLIQLDIEGYEPWALQGAWQTINEFGPVIMVEDKGLSEKYDAPKGWSESWLKPLGYRVVERAIRDVVLIRE